MGIEASAPREAEIPTFPDLAGKVAVVTGGSGGIGAATCRLLAANGANVVVNGRNESAIAAMVAGIRGQGGQAIAFAGGSKARPGPTAEIPEDDWRSSVDSNLTATFLTIKSFLPGMIERGGGSIVTMASSAARFPTDAPAPYAAAKAGVVMLTRQIASEVGEHGVRVNCLAPHTILTERIRSLMPEDRHRQIAAEIPLGRLGTPEDVGLAALFLASDASSWITGITLDVSGGRTMP